MQGRLDEQERRVSEFKKRHLGELPQQLEVNLATLERLNAQLRLNTDNQSRADASATPSRARCDEPVPGTVPGVAGRAGARRAAARAASAQELAELPTRFSDRYPDVDPGQGGDRRTWSASSPRPPTEARQARRAGGRHRRPRDSGGCGRSSPSIDAEIKVLQGEEGRLRAAIATYQRRVQDTPRREQEFKDLSRDYDSHEGAVRLPAQAVRRGPARREHGAAPEGRAVPGPRPGHALGQAGGAQPLRCCCS